MVTDLASGWPVTLRVGDAMTARLTADRAAGLGWSLRPGSDAGIVSVAGDPVFEASAGAPGVEVFRLVAVKPGQTTLTFDYRKGSDPAGLRSVSYPLTVQ
jgi:predicted secreted protein